MGCCGRRRADETEVERTQRQLRTAVVLVVLLSFVLLMAGLPGLFLMAFIDLLALYSLRASRTKNEKGLRKFVGCGMCSVVLVTVGMLLIVTVMGGQMHHARQVCIQRAQNEADANEMMELSNPNDKTMMEVENAASAQRQAEQKPMMSTRPVESENSAIPEGSNADGDDDMDTEDDGIDCDELRRSSRGIAMMVFFGSFLCMIFYSMLVATIMLAARLVRLLRVERASAAAFMMPQAAGTDDVALQPMASTGAPQVFYMPTADGQPQYVVYSPVAQA